MAKTVVVLGVRNLGGAILDHFGERGWNVAAVACRDDTLDSSPSLSAATFPASSCEGRSVAERVAG